MRPVFLGLPANKDDDKLFKEWVAGCFSEIELASQDDIPVIVKSFVTTNYTATRTLDASTATAADVAKVLCTLINDLQKRGMKRSQ